jgi:hypothetical protein
MDNRNVTLNKSTFIIEKVSRTNVHKKKLQSDNQFKQWKALEKIKEQ